METPLLINSKGECATPLQHREITREPELRRVDEESARTLYRANTPSSRLVVAEDVAVIASCLVRNDAAFANGDAISLNNDGYVDAAGTRH